MSATLPLIRSCTGAAPVSSSYSTRSCFAPVIEPKGTTKVPEPVSDKRISTLAMYVDETPKSCAAGWAPSSGGYASVPEKVNGCGEANDAPYYEPGMPRYEGARLAPPAFGLVALEMRESEEMATGTARSNCTATDS